MKSLLAILILVAGSTTVYGDTLSDSLADAAWRSWQVPDYALAENQFRGAIAADPSSERGYLGLALLQSMREKHKESWEAIKPLGERIQNSYPYIAAFWFTLRFRLRDDLKELGLLDYLEKLTSASDERGVLGAQITSGLAEYYSERGDLAEARKWHERTNAVSDWLLIGPFENVSASGYDKAYPPETEFDPKAEYEGKGGVPASWFPISSPLPSTWIDFTRHFPFRKSIFYANTFVYAPEKMKVHLRVGTSGSLRAFLNDEMVIEYFDENNNDLDTYIVATELQKGWNRVLIKCGCSEIEKCNFLVRITDEHGKRLEGLRYSTDLQQYSRKPSAPATVLENSFEVFFRNRQESHTDHPENYLLLAKLYLQNDKAPEAERILRQGLKKWPRCTMFYIVMMEAYQRGEKRDELNELLTKVSTIDDQLPEVLGYRIGEAMRNEEYQRVEELLGRVRQQLSSQENIYRIEMELLGKKKEIDKLVTLAKQAYTEYPLNWEFANLQALIEAKINRNPEKAAGIVGEYLKRKYGLEQLNTMASYYLQAGNFDKWEATMKEALDLSPTATGYFYSMGLVYQLTKNFSKAEKVLHQTLALCPGSSLYWSKLAEVYKSTDRFDEAKAAYRTGLRFESRDFDSREALRELEGKKPIFSAFTTFAIDSLIQIAPTQTDYPDDNSVILLDDMKRVVFEQGASMTSNELLVKPFSTKGIDAWKEYYIGYNSYNEVLTVEKAVTIKKDGTEVKADVDEGHIVFKSLEANESLYLKWKVKNYYNGMLAKHFLDMYHFNGYYPSRLNRYSLLVPSDLQFTHRTQLTPDTPTMRQVDDGLLYEWELTNEPAIRYEQGMPGLTDVGKMLFLSSLPSWDYVARWYSDLARTKTRSTFEIKDEVAGLFDGKPDMDEEQKVKTIYDFVTENIRYSSVSFRQSSFVPQRARNVLVHRLGDCKDEATLCIAMLREVGIKADYILVNTWDEGLNRNIPPSIAFNHCIVGVDLKSAVKYLDLTAANYPFGSLPKVVKGAFALPINNRDTRPVNLEPQQASSNSLVRTSTAVLNDDNSMTFTCSSRRYGIQGAYLRNRYRSKSEDERVRSLTEVLSNEYPNVRVTDLTAPNIDGLDPVAEDSFSYIVPHFVTDAGGFKLIRMPWSDKLEPREALSYESRTYPYVIWSDDTLKETLHLKFPAGYTLQEVPKSTKLSTALGEYSVTYKAAKGELLGERAYILTRTIVEPEEYLAFKEFYNEALREDNRQLLLKK